MKTETLELVIEELTAALTLERWRNERLKDENAALKDEVVELMKAKEGENGAI